MTNKGSPPFIEDYKLYNKIKSAQKNKSGVPGDLPRRVTMDFAPELAKAVGRIIRSICRTGLWPAQWKVEMVTAIGKIPIPESEDEL